MPEKVSDQKRWVRLHLLFTAALMLCSAMVASAGEKSDDTWAFDWQEGGLCKAAGINVASAVEHFKATAFDKGTWPDARPEARVAKWSRPVRFELLRLKDTDIYKADSGLSVVLQFNFLTHGNPGFDLDMNFPDTPSGENRNFAIFVAGSVADYELLYDRSAPTLGAPEVSLLARRIRSALRHDREMLRDGKGCFYAARIDGLGNIDKARAVVPGFGPHISACTMRVVLQSLGLTRTIVKNPLSLLSGNLSPTRAQASADMLMLRILYDRRFEPGMERKKSTPLIRKIVRDVCPSAN